MVSVIISYRVRAIFTPEVLWSQPEVLCLLPSDCVVTMATHRSLRLLILLLSLDAASSGDGTKGKTAGGGRSSGKTDGSSMSSVS